MRYIFGSRKQLLLHSNGLFHDGRAVKAATGKNLAVLNFLVQHHNEPVSFDELIAHAWPDTHFLGKKAQREAVRGAVYHIRNFLEENEPAEIEFIQTVPKTGYCFVAPVEISDSRQTQLPESIEERMTDIGLSSATDAKQELSELDSIHVHVDGAGALYVVESLVDEFNRKGWPSSKNTVLGFIEGPQRKEKPHIYGAHTPGGLDAENLAYFSTHLFGNFAATKRECHELLDRLNASQVGEIVVEAERVIGKLGYPGNEIQWSNVAHPDYTELCSGDVGYKIAQDTEPIEIHFSIDIPKTGVWSEKPPFDPEDLQPLVALSSAIGISVGGWFVFDKEKENKWAYRSNMFETHVDRYRIERSWQQLKMALSNRGQADGFESVVRTLVEHSIGIWKTPLKRYSAPRTVEELSNWEKKYPNLREFWVVTPNFLGDKEGAIQDAMIHNLLHRGVVYTYFLRSIADYNRLVKLAEELSRRTIEHGGVWNKIRAVILVREASDPIALDKVLAPDRGQGCFIANPLSLEGSEEADGYVLIRSKDKPGQISGGKVMTYEQVKGIVELLNPLVQSDSRQLCRPLQGFCMSLHPPENKEFAGVSIVCIGLKELPQLLNEIDDESCAELLREYDLLVASVTSQFSGHVARSIEPGYLLVFEKQDDAFACAEQIHLEANPTLKQRIAIDSGDVWRVMRAHGNEYCGKTVSRCREMLKRTRSGQVTMTHAFVDELPRSQAARVGEAQDHENSFVYNGKKIKILKLSK